MTKQRRKKRLLGKQVWCYDCIVKDPPKWEPSEFMVLLREKHYQLNIEGSEIDKSMIGVCAECVTTKNDFQQKSKRPLDIKDKRLVYRCV